MAPNAESDIDEATMKDFLDSGHAPVLQSLHKYQAATMTLRDKAVKPIEFKEGDLVLIWIATIENKSKLEQKWEGPFIIKKTSPSSYKLSSQIEVELEHSSNFYNLRKIYH